MWLIAALIVLNIPVYIFLGWLAFDSKAGAGRTFVETTVDVLKILLIPRWLRMMLDMETDNAVGIFPILGFFGACAFLIYGEWWILMKLFWPAELASI